MVDDKAIEVPAPEPRCPLCTRVLSPDTAKSFTFMSRNLCQKCWGVINDLHGLAERHHGPGADEAKELYDKAKKKLKGTPCNSETIEYARTKWNL